jgi:hypothetical protein
MERETNATAETPRNEYDPETETIMDILNQINAELDEIEEMIEGIGRIG